MPFFEQYDKVINFQPFIILLVELGKQRGVHPDKLLKGTKLFQQDLAQVPLLICHQQFVQLIENTNKHLNQPDIPFILGSRLLPNHLGHIGTALLNSPNINSMLRLSKCYQQLIFPFMFAMEKQANNQHYLVFNPAISIEKPDYHRFVCELLTTMLLSILKWRNCTTAALSIRFPYPMPAHIEQYHAYINGQFCFAPPANSAFSYSKNTSFSGLQIAFPNHQLAAPYDEANQAIMRHHLKQIAKNTTRIGFNQCVMQLIAKQFTQGHDTSLETIAGQLALSAATLKRKLKAHGTSYQQLLDIYRQQQAIFHLTEQGLSNEKVASALHFSDITNFRRSFKRWTGFTPNALKAAIQAQN